MSGDHKTVKPIQFVLFVILIAVFWEFFIGDNYNYNFDFSKDDQQKVFEQDLNNKKSNNKELNNNFDFKKFKVKRVVDGDTFIVEDHNNTNEEIKVRMLGINTPESVDPRRAVECFGKEASAKLESAIEGKYVYLETDVSQDKYDKYNRLLVYVTNESGEDINKNMITEGYAYEYTYQNNVYKKQLEYKQAENFAKFNLRGLWDKNACK